MIARATSLYLCAWTALATWTLSVGVRDWRTLSALALGYTLPRIAAIART